MSLCRAVQIILIGTMAATIWIRPFMDYWDNVISIVSMGGMLSHCSSACQLGGHLQALCL